MITLIKKILPLTALCALLNAATPSSENSEVELNLVFLSQETGYPITNAKIYLIDGESSMFLNPESHVKKLLGETDLAGSAKVKFPSTEDSILHIETPETFLDAIISLEILRRNLQPELEIHFPKAVSGGGKVTDTEGNPVTDGTLRVYTRSDQSDYERGIFFSGQFGGSKLDSNGQFKIKKLPESASILGIDFQGKKHSDYFYMSQNLNHENESEKMTSAESEEVIKTLNNLKNNTFILERDRGESLEIIVVNESDEPIADALVMYSKDNINRTKNTTSYEREQITRFSNDQGKVNFVLEVKNNESDYQIQEPDFTAKFKGYATTSIPYSELVEQENPKIILEKGRNIEVTVKDEIGNPLANALISTPEIFIPYPRYTDSNGQLKLTNVSNSTKEFYVIFEDYLPSTVELLAKKDDYQVTLFKKRKLRLYLEDNQTGEFIHNASVVTHFRKVGTDESWESSSSSACVVSNEKNEKDIWLELDNISPLFEYQFEVSSPVHKAQKSAIWTWNDNTDSFDFKLERLECIEVLVTDHLGNPVSNASLQLFKFNTDGTRIILEGDKQDFEGRVTQMLFREEIFKSDSTGSACIPPQIKNYTLIAYNSNGFSQVSCDPDAKSLRIKIQPWAKLTGRILDSQGDNKNITITAIFDYFDPYDFSQEINHLQTGITFKKITDNSGYFEFDKLPTGLPIALYVQQKEDAYDRGKLIDTITLEPGQNLNLEIPGLGISVTGQLIFPEIFKQSDREIIHSYTIQPGFENRYILPDDFNELSYSQQREILADEGKRIQSVRDAGSIQGARRGIDTYRVNENGSFITEKLLPGNYHITISSSFHEPIDDGYPGSARVYPIGSTVRNITITPELSIDSATNFDIGKIEIPLNEYGRNHFNKDIPEFAVTTLDGQSFSLAEQKGKFVLIDFWATWCGPCLRETPHLKKVFDSFGSDPRFVMLGVSFDREEEKLRQYISDEDLKWKQALISSRKERSEIQDQWRFTGIPNIILIGADGKRLANDLRGEKIYRAVSNALGKE